MTESWHFCNKAKSKYQIQVSKLNLPGGSDDKESACSAGHPGSIPGSGRYPGDHSSILAWKIPWKEDPGGLQSMGRQRVGHD